MRQAFTSAGSIDRVIGLFSVCFSSLIIERIVVINFSGSNSPDSMSQPLLICLTLNVLEF